MTGYAIRKLGWTALVLLVVSIIIFGAIRLVPSDVVDLMF